jgi:glyoxylase I family protein
LHKIQAITETIMGVNKTIKGCGFHHVSMKVKDLEKSRRFYMELGFIERYSWGKGEKRTLLLDMGDRNYFEISQGDAGQEPSEGMFRHIALRVDNCDAALKTARMAGAEVTVESRDVKLSGEPPIDIRIAFFKGPDGELIELFQNEET